jgi:hypothetical protein
MVLERMHRRSCDHPHDQGTPAAISWWQIKLNGDAMSTRFADRLAAGMTIDKYSNGGFLTAERALAVNHRCTRASARWSVPHADVVIHLHCAAVPCRAGGGRRPHASGCSSSGVLYGTLRVLLSEEDEPIEERVVRFDVNHAQA